ncbi:MAG: DUF805 domain-containing protein [Nocardioidaceae bacterium]
MTTPSYPSYPVGPEPTPEPVGLSQPLRGASLAEAVQRFFKKYAVFAGRASRSEFWYWELAAFIVSIVFSVLRQVSGAFLVLELLWTLAIIVPTFALGARRLHDIGKSGWWQLLALIPIVGWIIVIVWFATGPKPQGDQYNVNGV